MSLHSAVGIGSESDEKDELTNPSRFVSPLHDFFNKNVAFLLLNYFKKKCKGTREFDSFLGGNKEWERI